MIKQLTNNEFSNIEGVNQKIILQELEQAYESMMSPQLPELLQKNPKLSIQQISAASFLVSGYSTFDPLKVSTRLYACLDSFAGTEPNHVVCKTIRETSIVKINDEILKKLHRFRILV